MKNSLCFTIKNLTPKFPGYFIPFLGNTQSFFLIWSYFLSLTSTLNGLQRFCLVSYCQSVPASYRLIEKIDFSLPKSKGTVSFKKLVFPLPLLSTLCIQPYYKRCVFEKYRFLNQGLMPFHLFWSHVECCVKLCGVPMIGRVGSS